MKERLPVDSGTLLVIDQFMLGNSQFLEQIEGVDIDASALSGPVQAFGGCVLAVDPGGYQVFRDAAKRVMAICPEGSGPPEKPRGRDEEESEEDIEARALFFENVVQQRPEESSSELRVDTRCVAFVDAALLKNEKVLSEFRELRRRGREKSARDFLREHGATVRYGFDSSSDVFSVGPVEGGAVVALWAPPAAEEPTQDQSEASE